MQRRPFGRTGRDVSILSIGAMRLPKDDAEAVALLRRAIDLGCNYIDTSRGYGDSELKLAKALKDGYRDRVMLSTKCSPWIFQEDGYTASADHTRRKIDDSMQRLDVARLDFYQIWNITNAETFAQAIAPGGMVDGIRQAMDEGLVDHVAATTHAPLDVIHRIIDCGLFETLTVSYHLLNHEQEPVLEHAHRRNVGVVIMNPLAGGTLAHDSRVIRGLLADVSLPCWALALRFVLDHPHVTTAISGFSKLSDVETSVAVAEQPPLTLEQRESLTRRAAELFAQGRRFCTECEYCMPCPQGVLIRWIFQMATYARLFGLHESSRARYARLKPQERADACTQCGECETRCPNTLPIREELAKAHELLAAPATPAADCSGDKVKR